MDTRNGVFFSDEYQEYLKSQFSYADSDPEYGHRLFFENSGGSLRLKQAVESSGNLKSSPTAPSAQEAAAGIWECSSQRVPERS